MECNNSNDDGWGPCFSPEVIPPINVEFRSHGQIYNNIEEYDSFYYYKKLKKVEIIFENSIYTKVLYKGFIVSIPNKIIKYKNNKMYVHKKIFLKIFKTK